MKLAFTALAIVTALFSAMTKASPATTESSLTYSGNFHLDQSQSIFFEEFALATYALQLLQVKSKFHLNDMIIGGSLEFDLQQWHGGEILQIPLGIYQQGNGFYFTQATVDLMNNITPWMTTFFSMTDIHIGRGGPDGNNIYVPHAFILVGNLDKTPFYSTIGINNIPFGVFIGSGPWDTPLTFSYFSPSQAPQVSVGYYKNGLNAVATGFQDQVNNNYNYAYNIGYTKSAAGLGYSIGAGYLTDLKTNNTGYAIAHSDVIQAIPSQQVGNLGGIYDLNSSIRYHQLTLSGEYDIGSNKTNTNFKKPKAYAVTLNYVKNIAGRDTTFGVGRSVALHLKNVPAPLTGNDSIPYALHGLRNIWAFNISRPIFTNYIFLGLDLQKVIANAGGLKNTEKNTYTTTLDLTAYL
ncbi:MAG: hypothetical protein A3E84_03590 [Gammaproteobacteria bacterium RIFCSPHIGHO2_12_FULL_42_13]|nr:MAG: hypothetical protein A3E84_03590 [Gammaproteobacteria bacterium RIFCSPHIGHO2_12_FULL_42_13]